MEVQEFNKSMSLLRCEYVAIVQETVYVFCHIRVYGSYIHACFFNDSHDITSSALKRIHGCMNHISILGLSHR